MIETHTTGTAADNTAAQVITALGQARAERRQLIADIDDLMATEARLAERDGWDAPQVDAIARDIARFEDELARLNIRIKQMRAQLADAPTLPTLPTAIVRVVRAVS